MAEKVLDLPEKKLVVDESQKVLPEDLGKNPESAGNKLPVESKEGALKLPDQQLTKEPENYIIEVPGKELADEAGRKVDGGAKQAHLEAKKMDASAAKVEGDEATKATDAESIELQAKKLAAENTAGDDLVPGCEEAKDPPKQRRGPIGGTRFLKHNRWFAMCPVHANHCMELEEFIDPEAELRKYVRPGGPLEMVRYALLDEGVPVCADYPDWRYHPELSFVKSTDIPAYRRRRLERWLSEVCPMQQQPLERYDHFLVRCYDVATRELKSVISDEEDTEAYEAEFPHILDKWVARLHFGFVLRRKHMGKSRNRAEMQLILDLLREDCEILFLKGKLLLYDRSELMIQDQNPQPLWPQIMQSELGAGKLNPLDEMCGSTSLI